MGERERERSQLHEYIFDGREEREKEKFIVFLGRKEERERLIRKVASEREREC